MKIAKSGDQPASAKTVLQPVGRLAHRLGIEAVVYSDTEVSESNVYILVNGEKIPCYTNDAFKGIGYVWEAADRSGQRQARRMWKEFLEELQNNL